MIETERLILRAWREADAAGHRALVCLPAVTATLGPPPPGSASIEVVHRQNALLERYGSCFWAMEERAGGRWIGWCGVKPGPDGTPIAGQPEIGWTLHPDRWGHGLAREAAAAVLARTWAATPHGRVWSITTPGNPRSWKLMERLGLRRVPDGEFDHPALDEGDPLRRHLTYAIDRPDQGCGSDADRAAIAADSRWLSAAAPAASASSAG